MALNFKGVFQILNYGSVGKGESRVMEKSIEFYTGEGEVNLKRIEREKSRLDNSFDISFLEKKNVWIY